WIPNTVHGDTPPPPLPVDHIDNNPLDTTEVPEHLRKCLVQTVRAAWAIGYDDADIPHHNAQTWQELENSLHAGFTTTTTTNPLTHILELLDTLQNPDNNTEAITFVIDDGTTAHSFLATSEGLIFDTNTPEPPTTPGEQRTPRVRPTTQWQQTLPQTFPHIQDAYYLEFTKDTQGRLQPNPKPHPNGPT
ncbi:hypothetical protein, partial [Nocardia pseudovaccinii]|uniref:hypothetical protein n=1 Tax=Nocardia pseudovaccinii TaxID=189540 RepID=UPI000ACEEC32